MHTLTPFLWGLRELRRRKTSGAVSESGDVNRLTLRRRSPALALSDTHLLALLSDDIGGGIAIDSNRWERDSRQIISNVDSLNVRHDSLCIGSFLPPASLVIDSGSSTSAPPAPPFFFNIFWICFSTLSTSSSVFRFWLASNQAFLVDRSLTTRGTSSLLAGGEIPNPSSVLRVEKGSEMLELVDEAAVGVEDDAVAAAAGVPLAVTFLPPFPPFFFPPVPANAPHPSRSSRSFFKTLPSG
jgi:hypothetical protein